MSDCPFSSQNLERVTFWYYQNKKYIVMDAISTGKPLVILREHKKDFTPAEIKELRQVVDFVFGTDATLSFHRTQVMDHAHCHVIKKGLKPRPSFQGQ